MDGVLAQNGAQRWRRASGHSSMCDGVGRGSTDLSAAMRTKNKSQQKNMNYFQVQGFQNSVYPVGLKYTVSLQRLLLILTDSRLGGLAKKMDTISGGFLAKRPGWNGRVRRGAALEQDHAARGGGDGR